MVETLPSEPQVLGARELTGAFSFATDWLGVYVDEVNALNVYPVPDGDTGTNMHLTMQSVRRQFNTDQPRSMSEFARALAYGSLLGARGNSGVILSQILKGFAESAKEHGALDAARLKDALAEATRTAYAAVLKPVEGTILTVVRSVSEAAAETGEKRPLDLLRYAYRRGMAALEQTPEMLPLLKQAGVVDAGGLGFLRLLEGLIAFFEGRELPEPPKVERRAQLEFEEEEFGFCTEFLLSDVTVPASEIQQLVQPFGDSLLVVGAEGFVKGHIHTEEPERLLALVARYGTMVRSKVEDMSEQHSEILADVTAAALEAPLSAVVAVSDGYGVTKVFRSLGARVVGGGQTNNPSVEDIADAVRSVGAPEVVILPNNKNIILAAERVQDLVPGKRVTVLPTRTLGQGLAAVVSFSEERPLEEQLPELLAAAEGSMTLEVTRATRTVNLDGLAVEQGACIGLANGQLEVSQASPDQCLLELLGRHADEYEIGALFYSAEVGAEQAEETARAISERFEDLEVELHPGAPDLYPYVLTLE